MHVGIVGLPAVGKTTLFNALTGSHAETYGDKAHIGVATIPDPNLQIIASYLTTKKLAYATLQLVDIHGMPVGSDAKKLNVVLEQIRQVDGICHVVRCFDDGSGAINPASDIEEMETELVLADLVVADTARQKAEKYARGGDADAKARLAALEKITPLLEEGKAIRSTDEWTDGERLIIRTFGFVTAKPVVYIANVDESDLAGESELAGQVRRQAEARGGMCVAVCAKLEAELAEVEEPDRTEMLQSMGLAELAIGPVASAVHDALGLITFYTPGPKELRAWTVHRGATAPEAAGIVHSDMQRGFIRAECHSVEELVQHKSEKALREAGKLRVEGKHYVVQDGDCLHFLFNV